MDKIEYVVKDGVLSFNSSNDFFALGELILKMTPVQFSSWEKEIGFTSMRGEIQTAFEKLDTCTSIEEYQLILNQNSDILKVENELESPVIKSAFYQCVTNRKGYYIVADILHKITDEGLYTSNNDSFEFIETTVKSGAYLGSDKVQFLALKQQKLLKSTNSPTSVWDKTNWINSRRCYAEIYLDQIWTGNDPRTFKYYVTCLSQSIGRTIIFTEKLYEANHYCDDFDAELHVPMYLHTGYGGPYYVYENQSKTFSAEGPTSPTKTEKWINFELLANSITVSQAIINQIGIPEATILSAHGAFWTSGTGEDHKATLSYN